MKLTKREIILLSFLIIIALVFIEFTLILKPGLDRLSELNAEQADMQFRVDTINLDLTVAKNNEKKRDENLQKINELGAPFLNGVTTDALLVFTHEMLIKHGFSPFSYSPSSLSSELLQPESAEITALSYRLKEIAVEYNSLGTAEPEPGEPTTPTPSEVQVNDVVERYTVQVTASGSYDMIKALLDDYQSLNRTIIITNMSMTPNPTVGMLDVMFYVNYYGVEKLDQSPDPINTWTRETQPVTTVDPYNPAAVPTLPTETIPAG